ncbi:MAG: hypothetical protein LBB94_01475 [Clostridiales bacterium]|jgi:hypothetical protein|nr:hypothetical protein [Clostridiales bacterium]
MAADLNELFKKEAFKNLEPDKLEVFRKFATQLDGKSGPEIMSLYMKFSKELSRGRPLTHGEKLAVIEAIGESLPQTDQAKFKNITKMLEVFL